MDAGGPGGQAWNRYPLIWVTAAASAGVVLGRYGPVLSGWWLAALALDLGLWCALRRRPAYRRRAALVLAGCLLLAAAATNARWHQFRCDELGLCAARDDAPLVVDVELLTAPRTWRATADWAAGTPVTTYCTVRALRVRDGGNWRPASGRSRLQIRAELPGKWRAGDRVRVFGSYRVIDPPTNPGEFDRAAFSRGRRQLFQLHVAHAWGLQLLQAASPWSPRRRLEELRLRCREILEEFLSPSGAPLAAALLLGVRDQLDAQTLEPFLQTGTVHLLAISGLHLGMLVYVLFLVARLGWVRRRHALWLAMLLVVPYAILTAGQPPVVRAAMLAVGASLARLLGRPFSHWNLLGAGALLVLVLNPLHLFQAGVQLSFLAVATLLATTRPAWTRHSSDPLEQLIEQSRPSWQRRLRAFGRQALADVWTGLMVWLVTLPLVVYCFHRASPVAIVANPLLWFPIAGALCSGFLLLFTGGVLGPVSNAAAWACEVCLSGTMAGIRWAESWPGAHYWLPAPPWYLIVALYAALLLALVTQARGRQVARGLCLLMVIVSLAWCWLRGARDARDGSLRATFFDVGHGTCVLLEMPFGRNLIYDAGRFGPPQPLVDALAHTLWDRGVRKLDLVLVSHTDADHFNALPGLVERFPVAAVFVSTPLSASQSRLPRLLAEQLEQRGIPQSTLTAGDVFALPGGVELEVLHPNAAFEGRSDNERSLVVLLRFAGRTLLLPGDVEGTGLESLLRQAAPRLDVVMSPHHGSVTSNDRRWAAWSAARHVIISAAGPVPEATREAYLRQQTRIWDTASHGAVEVRIWPDGRLTIAGFRRAEEL